MKTKAITAGKFLAAAAAGAVMMTGVAAHSAVLSFLPGTSTNAPGAGTGIGTLPVPPFNVVDLFNSPAPVQFDTMSWVAYNNNFSNPWNIVQTSPTTFSETFSFSLQNLILDGNLSPAYGAAGLLGNGSSYVTMVMDVTGTYNGFTPGTDPESELNLNYDNGGTATMYFHPSGQAQDCAANDCSANQIAVFNITGGTARPVSAAGNDRTDLHWDMELINDSTNLAFFDADGDALAAPLIIALTDQQVLAGDAVGTTIPVSSAGIANGTTEFRIPEPGMLGLFGLGLLGLGIASNRRKNKRAA